MITSIRIDDNKKTPFKYIQKIKAFKNGSEFIFKPGVNVIVGKNGSGKSTLLNMISKYMLCEKKMCSELPSEALYLSKRTVDDFKGLVRRVQSGKFKPNKKNKELWDRFIDYFDIKNAKF